MTRWSASVVPLFVIALTLRTHRAVADRAAHQESAQDVLSPEQKRDLQYKSFAGLLSTMLILRQGGVEDAHGMVPYVRNLTRGYIVVHSFLNKHKEKFHDKKATEVQAQLDANVHLNDELLRLSLKFGKISARLGDKLNQAKTKKEKLYNATDAKVVKKINDVLFKVLGDKGVEAILNFNRDLGSTKLNTLFTPAAILPYKHFANQPNIIQNVILGLASNKIGIQINPCLFSYQGYGIDGTIAGINFQPMLLQIIPAAFKVAAVGVNIQPSLMTIAPNGFYLAPGGIKILPFLLGVVPAGAWIVPAGILITPFGLYWAPQGEHVNPSGLFIANITHILPGGFLGYPDSLFYQAFSKKGVVASKKGAAILAARARNATAKTAPSPAGARSASSPASAVASAYTGGGGGPSKSSPLSAAVGAGVGPTGVLPESKMSINSAGYVFENTFTMGSGPYLGPALPPGVSLAPIPSVAEMGEPVGPFPLPRPAGTS